MTTPKKYETVTAKPRLTLRASIRRIAVKVFARVFAVLYDKDLRRLAKT